MKMFEVDPNLLDEIAQGEVAAIREGLADPETRKDPRFLDRARKFLKDNDLIVSPRTKGIADIQRQIEKQHIPIFDDVRDGVDIDRLS